jgi:preprotein translocase subunit SecA
MMDNCHKVKFFDCELDAMIKIKITHQRLKKRFHLLIRRENETMITIKSHYLSYEEAIHMKHFIIDLNRNRILQSYNLFTTIKAYKTDEGIDFCIKKKNKRREDIERFQLSFREANEVKELINDALYGPNDDDEE